MYNQNNSYNDNSYGYNPYYTTYMNQNLENLYPDIYRVVYPMIITVCSNMYMPITNEIIENMIDNICDRVEENDRINVEAGNEFRYGNDPIFRPRHNRLFRDFIRVLLLRELIH